MALSDFIIRLLFLALPGLIGTTTYRLLKGRPENRKDWEDILEIALFSLLSYSIYGLGVTFTNYLQWTNTQVVISQAIFDAKIPINWLEVAITAIIGFLLAFVASFLYMKNTINTLGRVFRATSMFGNKDVWDFYHKTFGDQWTFVRDHKTDLVYYGHILAYSDSDKEREIIITDVDVYDNSTGEFRYKSPAVYLSRARDALTLELPFVEAKNKLSQEVTSHERARSEQKQSSNQDSRPSAPEESRGKGQRQSSPGKSKT